jgi:hypothetical protein
MMNILNYDKSMQWRKEKFSLYLADRLILCVEFPVCRYGGEIKWEGTEFVTT